MRKSRYLPVVSLTALGAACLMPAAAGAATTPKHVVVVSGLNNPRQLSLVNDDELLIAEAGKGGTTEVGSGDDTEYIGTSGSVSAVFLPQYAHATAPYRIVTGLLSGSQDPAGSYAAGSDGVSSRHAHGPVFVAETYAPPDALPTPAGTAQDGRLLKARPYHSVSAVANISAYEKKHDPDKQGFDSNPYAVLALPGQELVADAAGNDVLSVNAKGHVSLFHVFPNVTTGGCSNTGGDPTPAFPGCNYVPTALAVDRAGHVYVGGLVSEVPGAGRVTELSANGKHVLHTWKGFTSVDGVAVGPAGAVYVSQLEAAEANPPAAGVTGVLTRVGTNGKRTDVDVPAAAGVAVDKHGLVYVSAYSESASGGTHPQGSTPSPDTSGQVWRLKF